MNLIKADLYKLWKDRAFKVLLLILAVYVLLNMGVFKLFDFILDESAGDVINSLGSTATLSLLNPGNLGLFIAIAVSMFLGKDISYNTMRLKVTSGNPRAKIYLSSLAVAMVIGFAMFVFTFIFGFLLMLAFYGLPADFGNFMASFALQIPLYISFIAVMTFISMSLKTQMMGIIINVLVIMFVPGLFASLGMANDMLLNSEVFGFVLSLFPYHQANLLSGVTISTNGLFSSFLVNMEIVVKVLAASAIFTAGSTVLGNVLFKRSDIK